MFWLVAMAAAAIGSLLAVVIRMAISRSREFVADAGSVELTKNPDAMISALQKVAGHTHLDAPQSMRAMFLEEDDEGIFGLFATHPPVEKRIAALQRYAGGHASDQPAAAARALRERALAAVLGDASGPGRQARRPLGRPPERSLGLIRLNMRFSPRPRLAPHGLATRAFHEHDARRARQAVSRARGDRRRGRARACC